MNPRTSMGWGQGLHSVFLVLQRGRDDRESVSMNEGRGGVTPTGRGERLLHSPSQIQLMPLRGVDQVMTWGLLDEAPRSTGNEECRERISGGEKTERERERDC